MSRETTRKSAARSMSLQNKVALAISAAVALVVAGLVFLVLTDDGPTQPQRTADTASSGSALVRPDSRIIGERGSTDITFVEYWSFLICRGAISADR